VGSLGSLETPNAELRTPNDFVVGPSLRSDLFIHWSPQTLQILRTSPRRRVELFAYGRAPVPQIPRFYSKSRAASPLLLLAVWQKNGIFGNGRWSLRWKFFDSAGRCRARM